MEQNVLKVHSHRVYYAVIYALDLAACALNKLLFSVNKQPFYAAKYAVGTVPRPPHWTGFRIMPVAIEFWHDRPFRLHDRISFSRAEPNGDWTKHRLYP